MVNLPAGPFGAIVADPPWTFTVRSEKGKGRSAERHYDVMTLDQIKALPVAAAAARDCALFLWTIDTHLPMALEVISAWGFVYKTVGFHWFKTNIDQTLFTGTGYWTRANSEVCLLATRGAPKRVARDVPRAFMARRGRHSEKPAEVYRGVERLVCGPYLELFARRNRPGWTVWGDEVVDLGDLL